MSNAADKLLKKAGGTIDESLGVGIHDLLQTQPSADSSGPTAPAQEGRRRNRNAAFIAIDLIVPDPEQPRKTFDEEQLLSLAQSLLRHGQLQAIRARYRPEDGKYQIVSGERRWRASQIAGLKDLAVEVVDRKLSPEQILEDQLAENCQRSGLTPIEQGNAYLALMEHHDWTAQDLAEALAVSKSSVSKTLSLLGLSDDLREKINDGRLPTSVAYELTQLKDEARQTDLVERYERGELTRATVRKAIRKRKPRKRPEANSTVSFRLQGVVVETQNDSLDSLVFVLGVLLTEAEAARQEGQSLSQFAASLSARSVEEQLQETALDS